MYRQYTPGLPSTEGALSLEHLRAGQLKLLLQTEGLDVAGSSDREVLLARLRGHLVGALPSEWVMTALEGDSPHREYATVVCHDSQLYLFGGDCHHRSGSQPVAMNAIMRYNTNMGRWEPVTCKGTPPCERSGHSAVVHGGKMWVFGGWKWIVSGASGRMFNDLHVFDFRTKRWSEVEQKGEVPEPRAWHSVWAEGGRMLLYGDNGECEESKAMVGTVLVFDFDSSSWSTIPTTGDAPTPEMVEGICVAGDRMLALCYSKGSPSGEDSDSGMDVYCLELSSGRWGLCPIRGQRPSARIGCSTTVVGGEWVLHGGFPMHGTGEILADTFSFDLSAMSWSRIRSNGDSPLPRGGHTAVALGNSIVLLEGSTVHNSGRTRYEVQYCSVIEHLWQRPQPPAADSVVNSDMLAGVQRLYGDEELADVVLRVESGEVGEGCADGCGPGGSCAAGGSGEAGAGSCSGCSREFRAHRSVLAASSRVFDRMFRHTDVTESERREVVIGGVRPDVFEALLQYAYCSLSEVPPALATELFRAADRYDVEGLRTQCLSVLKQGLDVDNIGGFVLLADERGCSELLDACVAYSSHPDRFLSVLNSNSYLAMLQENARLGQCFTQDCAQRALVSSSTSTPRRQQDQQLLLGDGAGSSSSAPGTGGNAVAGGNALPALLAAGGGGQQQQLQALPPHRAAAAAAAALAGFHLGDFAAPDDGPLAAVRRAAIAEGGVRQAEEDEEELLGGG